MSDLPNEVSRATVNLGGFEIEFVMLDNGQRIVTAESMERFFEFLASGELGASMSHGEKQ